MCKIELDAPNLGELEKEYINRTIDENFVSTIGPFVPELEQVFAEFVRSPRAVSTQSGTAAIHIALYELGIGPGDEVIVPAMTFIASVNPVRYVGAETVFADVDPVTWTIDPEKVEECITPKTKAIIPVHVFGVPCRMDALMEIAKKHNLHIMEDATESLGATFHGQRTGTFGTFGTFSFNGNKIITTGGGGMVTGNDSQQMQHIKFLVNQARDENRGYFHPEIGFNYRMTNLEAALGLAQMKRLHGFLQQKRRFNEIYRQEFSNCDYITLQGAFPGSKASWWLNSVCFTDGTDIPQLQKKLRERGVPTRRLFVPATDFPPYAGCRKTDMTVTGKLYETGLSLPSSTLNSEEAIYKTCEIIKELTG